MGYQFSSQLTPTLNLCMIYFKITWALAILLEHIHTNADAICSANFFFASEKKKSLAKSKISPAKTWFYLVKMYFSPAKFNFSSAKFFFRRRKKNSSSRWHWHKSYLLLAQNMKYYLKLAYFLWTSSIYLFKPMLNVMRTVYSRPVT